MSQATQASVAAPSLLVSGATGFLGGHVLDALQARWPQLAVAVLVRDAQAWHASPQAQRHPRAVVIEGTLHDAPRLSTHPQLQRLKVVAHLAASVRHSREDGDALYRINVAGSLALLELARLRQARMVLVSTSGTVGCSLNPDCAPVETAPYALPLVERWPYYHSKILAEQRVREAARAAGTTLSILRPPALLGPGDVRGRATGLVRKFLAKKLPFCLSGGTHIADVRDVAAAIVDVCMLERPRPIYHLPGHAEPLRTFFARLEALSAVPAPRHTIPFHVAHLVARLTHDAGLRFVGRPLPPRLDPVMVEMGRCHWGLGSLFQQELGYVARPLEQTLRDTLAGL